MSEILFYLKCNVRLFLKNFIVFGIIKISLHFCKISGLDFGFSLGKNYQVSVHHLTTSLKDGRKSIDFEKKF